MIRAVAVLVCGALAGCNALQTQQQGIESRQVTELVDYTQKVAALRTADQRRELNVSNQMFSKKQGDYNRVRLALLLALPGTSFNEDVRAVELLEPLASSAVTGPMSQFAGLLHTQVSERLRRSAQLREQLEAAKVAERNAAQLKEQLDAMRAIERKLLERELGRPR